MLFVLRILKNLVFTLLGFLVLNMRCQIY